MDVIAKRKRISDEIVSEVDDLHPLLDRLFKLHPKINSVEYTHGPNEMGADFVLCRIDEILNTPKYIGVVAKAGKIHQDFSDVERQVDECGVIRNVENGKKEIFLDEVWVLTSKTISNNAERKIKDKYVTKNIAFIEQDALISWIDELWPAYWDKFPLHLGEYLRTLKTKVESLDERYSLIPSKKNLYFNRDIYFTEEEFGKQKKFELKKLLRENKLVFLESAAGIGKSKLIRRSILDLCDPQVYSETKIVPLFCTYYEFVHSFNSSIRTVFESTCSQELLSECDESVRYVFFIDGIDEVKLSFAEHEEKLRDVCREINSDERFKLFAASRPISSFSEEKLSIESSLAISLAPLSKKNVLEFVKAICESAPLSRRLYEDISKSHFIRDIAKTPIAAILLGRLLESTKTDLPSNMTELYGKYFELMLGRWDADKGIGVNIEYELSAVFLMDIAHFMNENNLQQIAYNEARQRFVDYLRARNLNAVASEIIDYLIDRTGVISKDPISESLSFKHKSFMDYFDARHSFVGDPLDVDGRVFSQYWSTVYFFYIGMKKDCAPFLRKVMKTEAVTLENRLARSFLFGDYLLAGYQSPYEVVNEYLPKIVIEHAKLYSDVLNKRVDSALKVFPPMVLLHFHSFLMRYSFSYDFFRKALPHAIQVIDDDQALSDEEKSAALFFIGYVQLELGDTFGFEYLIEKHERDLPLQIRLAIRHEAGNIEHIPAIIKKAVKKLGKDLQSSRSLLSLKNQLYKKK